LGATVWGFSSPVLYRPCKQRGGGGGDISRWGLCGAIHLHRRKQVAAEAAAVVQQHHPTSFGRKKGSWSGSKLLVGPPASVMHLSYITFYTLFLFSLKDSHQCRFHLHKGVVKQFCKS